MVSLDVLLKRVLLDNALRHGGVCTPRVAVSVVMREHPRYRDKHEHVLAAATRVAETVNALSLDAQRAMLDDLGGTDAPEREVKDPFHLDHPGPVLRLEPSPSGPLHIGHTYPLGMNYLLAKRNAGTLIIRISDTNPENIFPPAYDMIVDDAQWFTEGGVDAVHVQSDRMLLYYTYAERMLSAGWAYVCTCDADAFKDRVSRKEACPCRELPPAVQLERWELMRTTYLPGDAVVRMKTDLSHKNPAMRDWPAFRINTSVHPRQGLTYRVWPLMNFAVSVDDMEMGMTHVLRAKDHADNAKRQAQFFSFFHVEPPVVYSVGRINFTGFRLSTSETRRRIEAGEFSGWDDIRLPFLAALRRRGFQPGALLRQAEAMGFSMTDKSLSMQEYFTSIEAFNRELLDPVADRAFFVREPLHLSIHGAPTVSVERDVHPSARRGGRSFTVGTEVWVDPDDVADRDGVLFRLMDAYNFRWDGTRWVFVSVAVEEYKAAPKRRILQYLPKDAAVVPMRMHLPDGSWQSGIAEERVAAYPAGSVLQFERAGFARIDRAEPLECWFAHR